MSQKSRSVWVLLTLFLVLYISSQSNTVVGASSAYIHIKVTDAKTSPLQPIEGATVIVWDMSSRGMEQPVPGRGIYSTDNNGEVNITGDYVKPGHSYRIYAFKANFSAGIAEYVPSVLVFDFPLFQTSHNVSFRLLPAALIILEGDIYSVETSGPGVSITVEVIDPQSGSPPSLGTDYLSRYDMISAWYIGASPRFVVVPADVALKLITETRFFVREGPSRTTFRLEEAGGMPFNLTRGSKVIIDVSRVSLEDSLRKILTKFTDTTLLLNTARNVGFVIYEERKSLAEAQLRIDDAYRNLGVSDYHNSWAAMREAFVKMELIARSIDTMRLISLTSAVYLPSILSVFAIILAFFLFEQDRRKMISSVMIYAIFIIVFYFIYPGMMLIVNENFRLFLITVSGSFIVVSAVIFGVPRVWKERKVEGEVSLRSAASIIFSMGKRQIRRKRIRGFFTILSMILLVLAFTSLTSFGAIIGIVSKGIVQTPLYEGILVERLVNETSPSSVRLTDDEPSILSKTLPIKDVAPRMMNQPVSDPLATLVNPVTGQSVPIYGILGIEPVNETIYTQINNLVVNGEYLGAEQSDEILLSTNLANALGVNINESVQLYISGIPGLLGNFTIKGLIRGDGYDSLTDIDGRPFGPLRYLSDGSLKACNSSEVILMNWLTFRGLKQRTAAITGEVPEFLALFKIVFQPIDWSELNSLVNKLVLTVYDYNVFVSFNNIITHYFIGSYAEAKGAVELLIPLFMAGLNVGAVMLNAVYERRKEISVLSMIGLNPAHIAATFVSEAIIIGMVGGGLGYLFGLGFFRLMALFGSGIMVREKLEWWWSAIAFALALVASVLSTLRPAMLAVSLYTPSKVRKTKVEGVTKDEVIKEREARKDALFKAFQARELSMPVKVKPYEMAFFYNYILDRLTELSVRSLERTQNIEDVPEIENVKGELVKTVRFNYAITVSGDRRETKNEVIAVKSRDEDYYRIRLSCAPATSGTPITAIDRTIDFVHDLILEWIKNKDRLMR